MNILYYIYYKIIVTGYTTTGSSGNTPLPHIFKKGGLLYRM
jgi:hypothetical protein